MAWSLEYRYPILGNLGISVFYDLAQVGENPGDINFKFEGETGLRQSIGAGLHYVTPIGPLHRGPGEINFPICCGGVVVNPGDLVVGDAMGVVIIPQGIAAGAVGAVSGLAATTTPRASVTQGTPGGQSPSVTHGRWSRLHSPPAQ